MSGGGWDDFLEDGEHILWQGQPEPGIDWTAALTPVTLFGIFFAAFALFWIAASFAMIAGSDTPFPFSLFPLFGLPFLAIGLFLAFGHLIWADQTRRRTWYSVSTRQLFIATTLFGRRQLDTFEIDQIVDLDLHDGAPGSVLFEVDRPLGYRTSRRTGPGGMGPATGREKRGFIRISEARKVFGLIRDQQRALRRAAHAGTETP